MHLFVFIVSVVLEAQLSLGMPAEMRKIVSYKEVPKYKVIRFLTDQLLSLEEKVKDIPVSESLLYHHIFDGADICEHDLTLVSKNTHEKRIEGVNMVMRQENISQMYGAGSLNSVLDFVLSCYNWAKPTHFSPHNGFVSILRAYSNKAVNEELIKATIDRLKALTLINSEPMYHFLWETNSKEMSEFLTNLGYTKVICGRSEPSCDWSKVGMPKRIAENQCLYQVKLTK